MRLVRPHVLFDEVRAHEHVVVDEDDDVPNRALDPHVARLPGAKAEILLPRVHERQAAREASRDRFGLVGRAVVAHDDAREVRALLPR